MTRPSFLPRFVSFLGMLSLLLLVPSWGCRTPGPGPDGTAKNDGITNPDGSTETPPTEQTGDQPPPDQISSGLTIMDLQDATSPKHPAKGAVVSIKGLIATSQVWVTSRDAQDNPRLLAFFVADPSFPSKFGGVQVVVDPDFGSLSIGDVVDVEGFADEFKSQQATSGNTQLNAQASKGGSVKKTGENKKDAIKPTLVKGEDLPADPADKINPDASKAEPYEGMLVEIQNAEVEEEADQYGVWKIKGGAQVDDTLYRGFKPKKGSSLKFVRGILQYSFDKYTILPRGFSDLDGGVPTCTKDADCNRGQRCAVDIGQCQDVVCAKDADCGQGETCNVNTQRCTVPARDLKIADVQDASSPNAVRKNDPVQLKGVIVTSAIFAPSTALKGFFVADPAFPPKFSGVQVVVEAAFTQTLEVGDVIDIEGKADEFFFNTQVRAVSTEGGKITKTGQNKKADIKATTVTSDDVSATPSSVAAPDTSKAEPYEGMLVELQNVTVDADTDQFGVTKLQGGALLDDTLFKGYTAKKGDVIPLVRGLVAYSFDLYRILPRSADDIGGIKKCTTDADCQATETCDVQSQICKAKPPTLTIMDIQDPASPKRPAAKAKVNLTAVIVTSPLYTVSANLKGFYVSDPSFPSKFGGIQVVVEGAFAQTLDLGDVIDLQGAYEEFNFNSQVNANVGGGGKVTKTGQNKVGDIKPLVLPISAIPVAPVDENNPDTSPAEAYEGMLIELQNVTVEADTDQFGVFKLVGGAVGANTIFPTAKPKAQEKFSVLRGIVQYSFKQYRILPRSQDDLKP